MSETQGKKQNKKLRPFLLLTALIVVAALAVTTVAYLVKHDEIKNTFTVATLDIELIEADWYNERQTTVTQIEAAKLTAPGSTIPKAPKIKNHDVSDAYVFLKVTVPYFDSNDGAKIDASDGTPSTIHPDDKIPLYKFVVGNAKDSTLTAAQTIRNPNGTSGWLLINGAGFTNPSSDTEHQTLTYIYAYVNNSNNLLALAKDEETPTVFDSVYITNFSTSAEQMSSNTGVKNIKVEAFGIQTTYLNDNDSNTVTDPLTVWKKIEANGA